MHGSKIDVLLELIQPLVESQLCVVFCPSWQAEIGQKRSFKTLMMGCGRRGSLRIKKI
jgi:hypothetical protein